jgi:hypothetical protein
MKRIAMKMNFSVPMAFLLALAPGITLAMNGTGAGHQSQPQSPVVETSHALLPNTIDRSAQTQTTTTAKSPLPQADQFQNCSRLVSQVRDQARALANSASTISFNSEVTTRQHKELRESLVNLKQEHERFYNGLTQEQQNSAQLRNASLLQAHDRLQNLVKEMDRELTDSTLHSREVAEQARSTQRELKSYQKEFRAMGKDLGFKND